MLGVLVIIFGVGKLPKVGKYLGKSVREFRKGQQEMEEVKKDLTIDKQ